MTFPTYVSTTETATRATGNAFTGNMPASGINSGDFIVLIISRNLTQTQTFSQSSGPTFTAVQNAWGSYGASISSGTLAIFKRTADGTENGATTNWTSSFNSAGNCVALVTVIVFRATDPTTPLVVSSTTGTGNSANPDPPSLATGTSKDYMWVSYAVGSTSSSISAYPTNYSTGHSSGGASGMFCGSAIRSLTAGTEDPGTFTSSLSGQWGAKTFAIGGVMPAAIRNQAVIIP